VQYLHGALVAHGDLKPSNIFVTAMGEVKLLDFGAARLLASTAATMTRAFLTPHYASPEQKQGEGPSVASDIYALGVILGEVFPEAEGDMTAIREMCRRPEPGERYGSVLELAQDLERYRARQPVRARRQDRRYRAGKFLQRHVVAVSVTAAVVAALGTAAGFGWREVRRDRERLAQMRGVVQSVLRSADRRAMQGAMETAIGELEKSGEKGMELDLAAAWRRVGAARLEEGDTPGGMVALRRAYELAEQVWVDKRDPAAMASKATTLPMWALALQTRREGPEATQLAKRAVALHEEYKKVFGTPLPEENPYYRLIINFGPVLARHGEVAEARRLLEEALGVARRVKSGEYTGRALIELAVVEERAGQREKKAAYCREAATVAPLAPRLREVCGPATPSDLGVPEQILGLREKISTKREELRHDPERFQSMRRLAGMHQ
jgi:tetratricopeptide (TPR) repeat protein